MSQAATSERPDRTEYYLGLAVAVAARAECKGLSVGAVLVKDNRVISTGYNGTPEGWNNCSEGGACPRCDTRDAFGSGNGYDKCICVHAEMNAIAAAARYGMSTDGGVAYVTHEPCLTCSKELVQAGIETVFYCVPAPAYTETDEAVRLHLQETRSRFQGQLQGRRVEQEVVVGWLSAAVNAFSGGPGRSGSEPATESLGLQTKSDSTNSPASTGPASRFDPPRPPTPSVRGS